jgi:branched-chain amino acid transport system substrate-binding protein
MMFKRFPWPGKPSLRGRLRCLIAPAVVTCLLAVPAGVAIAQDRLPVIGLVAPLSGPIAPIGNQMKLASELFAIDAEILPIDDKCTEDGAADVAAAILATEPAFLIGFPCSESLQAALPLLKSRPTAIIAIDLRTEALSEQALDNGISLYRLAPQPGAEAAAVGAILTDMWRTEPFAIVDDGTIASRELAEALRAAAEEAGLKPVYVDTFRPQLENQVALIERLRKAGATRLFVGGDRSDVAIIARDAATRGLALEIAAGEGLDAADGDIPLPDGVIMIGLPDWLQYSEDTRAMAELVRSDATEPTSQMWLTMAAMEIAGTVLETRTNDQPVTQLENREFATVLGPVRFNPDGFWNRSTYSAYVWRAGRFVPLNPAAGDGE